MKRNLIIVCLLASQGAWAVQFSDIVLWAGSGTNQAAVVIDFNDGQTPRSYVWGYRWSGTATGEDALRAIAALDDELEIVAPTSSFGAFLDEAKYKRTGPSSWRHQQASDSVTTQRFWSYYWTSEGATTWSEAGVGMSARQLFNGAVDGWTFSNPGYQGLAPSAPIAAVPEPATLAALSVGALAVLRRNRKNASKA